MNLKYEWINTTIYNTATVPCLCVFIIVDIAYNERIVGTGYFLPVKARLQAIGQSLFAYFYLLNYNLRV